MCRLTEALAEAFGALTTCKIDTELVIPACPSQVWAVFGEFAKWGDWNDFMVLSVPPKCVGKHCRVVFRLEGGFVKRSVHDPEIVVLKENKELRWKDDRGWLMNLFFQGSHWYVLEALPNGHTRFVHGAVMMGLAIPVLGATMRATYNGYNKFNQLLCDEVVARIKRQVGKRNTTKLVS